MSIVEDLFGLEGKVAVVTGGSGAIGRTLAAGLWRAGARVAILGRRADACTATCANIDIDGTRTLALAADVLQPAEVGRRQAHHRLAEGDHVVGHGG